jgi:hypothetical protein
MATKRKYSAGRVYSAKYSFPTKFNAAGDVVSVSTLTTDFSGKSILQFGLKNVIWHHAKRLNVPKGYSCVVDEG